MSNSQRATAEGKNNRRLQTPDLGDVHGRGSVDKSDI